MCKDNATKSPTNSKPLTATDAHSIAALALMSRLQDAFETRRTVQGIRDRGEDIEGLDEVEAMIGLRVDRLFDEASALINLAERTKDEADALRMFEDEYDCDCGCSEHAAGAQSYEDEDEDEERIEGAHAGEEDEDDEDEDGEEFKQWPPYIASLLRRKQRPAPRKQQAAPRRPGMTSMVLGAIGVGCAVAALASEWLNERKG
jgi:hypothetical protein